MLSIEVRINRDLIGYASVVNTGESSRKGDLYDIEYFRPGQEPQVMNFQVIHDPKDGAEKLISLVYQKIVKKIKN